MIYPKCKTKASQVPAIRYDGYVVPCCHMAGWQHIDELRERMGNLVEQMHITNGTLDQINESEAYQFIEKSFNNNPFPACVLYCSDPDSASENKTNANSDFDLISLGDEK
jgi:hypothetical protein